METEASCLEIRRSEGRISNNLERALNKIPSVGMRRNRKEMAEEKSQGRI